MSRGNTETRTQLLIRSGVQCALALHGSRSVARSESADFRTRDWDPGSSCNTRPCCTPDSGIVSKSLETRTMSPRSSRPRGREIGRQFDASLIACRSLPPRPDYLPRSVLSSSRPRLPLPCLRPSALVCGSSAPVPSVLSSVFSFQCSEFVRVRATSSRLSASVCVGLRLVLSDSSWRSWRLGG